MSALESSRTTTVLAMGLVVALVVYAGFAAHAGWWLSALAAPVVAWLLWRRHPRARFAAYVLLSVVAVRAVATAAWPLLAFALAAIAVLQTRAAARAWPRLAPGRTRAPAEGDGGDRMARP